MGLIKDLFYPSEADAKKKPVAGVPGAFEEDYEDYYGELHDEAICGNLAAEEEMREEFGDDWEGEF